MRVCVPQLVTSLVNFVRWRARFVTVGVGIQYYVTVKQYCVIVMITSVYIGACLAGKCKLAFIWSVYSSCDQSGKLAVYYL